MKIPFITTNVFEGHYPVNWYFQKEGFNGRPALVGTPGLVLWSDTGYDAEVRGIDKLNSSYAYAVVGEKIYRLSTDGTSTLCTGTLETSSGIVNMETNGTYVMITDGSYGYYISDTTLTKITDSDFPTPSSLTYQDGYFIVTQSGTGHFFISSLNDPSAWDPLDYSSAEGLPDNIIKTCMLHRELFMFGTESIEPFQNTGSSDFPFQRVDGAFIEIGLGAANSVCKMDNSLFWLADDYTIRRLSGYTPTVISPDSLNKKISDYTTKSDCFAYSYKQAGGTFAVFTFPTEEKTWVFNAATAAWHQWSCGLSGGRHRSNCHCFFNNKNLVGDYSNGKIYEISDSTYTDDGNTIKRTRISPALFDTQDRALIVYKALEIEFKVGVGLASGQGDDPEVMLRYSDNGCRTWSNEKWQKIGKIGKYEDRARWVMLGSSRMRNFEISITDPVDAVLISAYADIGKNRN